jgi:hypothetical protein
MVTKRNYRPLWWDRDVDDQGVPIRDDVRRAAQELWPTCCSRTRAKFGDTADAAELMEDTVSSVSRYLTKHRAPPFYPQAKSLVSLHFEQSLKRLARRLGRVVAVGLVPDLEALSAPSWDWVLEIHVWHDFEKLHDEVDDRGWIECAMRFLGHGWPEVAEKLGIAISTAKNHFGTQFKEGWARLNGRAGRPKTNGKGAGK